MIRSKPTIACARLATLLAETPEAAKALAALEAGLAAHADTCSRCQAELATARRIVDELALLHADFEPRPLTANAMNRAVVAVDGARSTARGYLYAALVGAAAAIAAVLLLRPTPPDATDAPEAHAPIASPTPTRTAEPAPPNVDRAAASQGLAVTACLGDGGESSCDVGAELVTAIAQSRAFRLSDGSTLQVDQDSVVRFDATRRALTIVRGDAFLDVAHREDLAPLVVTLPTGEAHVLGTELEVRAGESLSVVDVKTGVVEVAGAGGDARVKAGQTAWLRSGRRPLVRTSSGTSDPRRDFRPRTDEGPQANLGFGSIRARRPGAATDADTPLRLVDHLVDVKVQGAIAKTTIEESFASDEAHELEGIYRFTLPPGAQVAELALMVDGRWEEGGFVERDRADKIWAGVIRQATPIIKRREIVEYIWVPGPWRDPALLSWKQGNTFELRIFPIPARGERRVRIAYTETLPLVTGARRYVLPLPSAGANARAERFAVDVAIGTSVPPEDVRVRNYALERTRDGERVRLASELRGFRPAGDLVIEIPDLAALDDLVAVGWGKPRGDGEADEAVDGYVALTLRPELAALARERTPLDVVIIADTSYGIQQVRLARAAEIVAEVVAGLDPEDRVQVLACATSCRKLNRLEAASASLGRDLGARLKGIEPLGATRLEAAFEAAREALGDTPEERRRVLYMGDGVQTVGDLDPARVVEAIRAVVGEARVTTIGLGGETDRVVLEGLARDHAGSFVDYAAFESTALTARHIILRQHGEPLRDVELTLPESLVEVAPARFGDLWPGDERVVTARARSADVEGDVVLRGTLAGEPVERRWRLEVTLDEQAGNAFVPRLWAERRIADLSVRDDASTKAEVVELSKRHHVLSRFTSLLVLESPAMARAFDVHATRPVAEWSGDEAAVVDNGELAAATGGVVHDVVSEAGAEEELQAAGTRAPFAQPLAGAGGMASNEDKSVFKDLELSDPPVAATPDTGDLRSKGLLGKSASDAPATPRPAERREDWGRGGRWVPMKKVWYKEALIGPHREGDDAAAERELVLRERRLDEEPNSRERMMALVRWHLRQDALEQAERLARRWLEKDRMDPEALVALADVAALRGDLSRSELLLSSAVEADPQRAPAHLRMARLYEAAGQGHLACEHLLSRALVTRSDVTAQVDAIRCGAREARVLAGLEEGLRARVERALDKTPKATNVTGPYRLDARWDGEADLDIVVVTPQGKVVSWQGGLERSVEDAQGLDRESLVFKGSENGRWQVFVVRKDVDDRVPVQGTLRVTAHGATRRLSFSLAAGEATAAVAEVQVAAKFRWEEVR